MWERVEKMALENPEVSILKESLLLFLLLLSLVLFISFLLS